MNILALLQPLNPVLSSTTIRRMNVVIYAVLAMTGRVTMLGISRWTGKGGSYRTVQRFFHSAIPWKEVMWLFFCLHLLQGADEYILAGDESVVTKAGKETYGLDRFFAGLLGKPVSSVAFFALSLVNTRERRSYPLLAKQVIRTAEEKAAARKKRQAKKAKKQQPHGKPGRRPGTKNRDKTAVTLTPELQRIQAMIREFLLLAGTQVKLSYIVLDGHFGNNNALQMVRQCGLRLVSKLRSDSELYFPYEGDNKRRKYGDRIDYVHIPARYLCETTWEKEIRSDIYQARMWHREFAQLLNVVVMVKTHMRSGARLHVVLFSSDSDLGWDRLIEFYKLRFQIEFNFRDAKQYWGLEDFMAVKEAPVTNSINLSLFMVNVASALLREWRREDSTVNVLDLKAHFRAHKYVNETLKLLPEKPNPFFCDSILNQVSRLGRIHLPVPSLNSS